ncbi:hypothetical protein QYF61_001110 [Mycteria americana]|uniref:Uncharacterized protein n=1 Tax=Mycteria americana TaxID=33587 RepID=A0AAN7MI43_MYCAM|nr:hypothetical protein QYF61_001110 [Mycteria americana]
MGTDFLAGPVVIGQGLQRYFNILRTLKGLDVDLVSRLKGDPLQIFANSSGCILKECRKISKQFKNIIQRSAPRPDSYEWQGVVDSMGKCLGRWVSWFSPSRQLSTTQPLAHSPSNPQGSGDKTTGTAATLAPLATGTAAIPDHSATGTVVTPVPPGTDNAVQSGNQPVSVSVSLIHKKKTWKRKSARLEREDERAGTSQGEEEEELVNETETTRSLSLSELQDTLKDFSHHPGEHVVTWLLRCWDSGASSLELEGKEAKQLGSISREGGIDKAIGKGAPAHSLWRRLLSAMKERYPFKEDVIYHPGKRTTMERGIQYLRELAMLEVIYGDLDNERLSKDPDKVQCT